MIKHILILATVFHYAIAVFGQNTLDFKVEYKIGHSYSQKLDHRSHIIATYTGNAARINELKTKGMKNPSTSDKQLKLECKTSCSPTLINGRMIMNMQFMKATGNAINIPKSFNAPIHLHKYPGKEPVVDSINFKLTKEQYKEQWLPMVQTMLAQMVLAPQKLKLGAAMREQSVQKLTAAGKVNDILVTTTYSLKKVSADSAWFDITQVFSLKSGTKDSKTSIRGSGAGKMVYDIKNHYISRRQMASDVNLTITQGNISVESAEHNIINEEIKMSN